QKAVAYGLAKEPAYFDRLAGDLQAKRDRLARACAALRLPVLPCQGTYFLTLDMSRLELDGDDAALARRMTAEGGVTAVPVSAFYVSDPPKNYLRFCFSKRDEVLDEAVERMQRWIASIRRHAA
ncbi:MAG TPA: aminotransferase class I/II-fold pyridoxal phosphate-dependent enzyme, partial [Propylenella sp.]|nr:aminotransferase class I/II-fold pyridoxal phosphate-dependent enzyme [Propylenella sp.]